MAWRASYQTRFTSLTPSAARQPVPSSRASPTLLRWCDACLGQPWTQSPPCQWCHTVTSKPWTCFSPVGLKRNWQKHRQLWPQLTFLSEPWPRHWTCSMYTRGMVNCVGCGAFKFSWGEAWDLSNKTGGSCRRDGGLCSCLMARNNVWWATFCPLPHLFIPEKTGQCFPWTHSCWQI